MKADLIGYGYWGKILERYIRESFTLENIYNRDYKINNIDAVFIATPAESHYDIALKYLNEGINVFCEKPLTLHYEECLELKEIAEKKNCVIYTDYLEMCNPYIKEMKSLSEFYKVISIYSSFKQLGKFITLPVGWQLLSHQLSLISLFTSIKNIDILYKGSVNECKVIINDNIFLESSRVFKGKEKEFKIYMDGLIMIYTGVEKNNLRYSINHFKKILNKEEKNNINVSCDITKIIEGIYK